ncbi:MAG: hypothetical protein L3J67_07380 [Hyphomicrobiaceae bacterium]|nr:hypothetical protein [Hyphomicrobiaceae bacterium]
MNEPLNGMEIFLSWLPMLLLTGVWVYFMRGLKSKSGKTPVVLQEELLIEVRRQNDLIEDVIKDHGERILRLEEKLK